MNILKNLGRREALVYTAMLLWIFMGVLAAFNDVDFVDLAIYFGSLTAYVATYIWSETSRPSEKTGILKSGPTSRREAMIYIVIALWVITGVIGILKGVNIESLGIYFVSLTGFVGAWIAGEKYKPEDHIIKKKNGYDDMEYEEDAFDDFDGEY
jgi:hypothetical protein